MLMQIAASIYTLNTGEKPSLNSLKEAVTRLPDNDFIVEIHEGDKVYFCTKTLLDNGLAMEDIRVPMNAEVFRNARRIIGHAGLALVVNPDGSYGACLKDIPTYYVHPYTGDGDYDLDFLNRFDCVVLDDCNEYSVVLLDAMKNWKGKRIVLSGKNWKPFLPYIGIPDREVVFTEEKPENGALDDCEMKILEVEAFLPTSAHRDRLLCYDEVMTLTCLFCCRQHPGEKNRGKKFFLINGAYSIEGIFGIWEKVNTAAQYVQHKGYIPVINITWSDDSIYSDEKGDDIWRKFFKQPSSYSVEEVLESESVTFSPNMNILGNLRSIMKEASKGETLLWENGIFNDEVENYIRAGREKFLPEPENTLGVLIRGTDYTKTHMPGHAIHADTGMVIEKIRETETERGEYKYIYLATEDEEIYDRMKEEFPERLLATDQERFKVKEGELLFEQHKKKKTRGNGFRLGAEYLCTLRLLSECESLIASGDCGGVKEALRENNNGYSHVFIFNLGNNPC